MMRFWEHLLPASNSSGNLSTSVSQSSYVNVGGTVASVAGIVVALCVFYFCYRVFTHRSSESSQQEQTNTGPQSSMGGQSMGGQSMGRPPVPMYQANMHQHQRPPYSPPPQSPVPASFSAYHYLSYTAPYLGQHISPASPGSPNTPGHNLHQHHSFPYSPTSMSANAHTPPPQTPPPPPPPPLRFQTYQSYQYDPSGPFGTGRGRPNANDRASGTGNSSASASANTSRTSLTEGDVDELIASVVTTFPPTSSHDAQVCPICLDPLQSYPPLAALPCLHTAHAECLNMWLRKDRALSCPVCRVPARLHQPNSPRVNRSQLSYGSGRHFI